MPARVRDNHPMLRATFHANPLSRPMGAGRDLFGLRTDGTEIPVEIGLNPIEHRGRRFVLASVVDISPRKQAEEELRDRTRSCSGSPTSRRTTCRSRCARWRATCSCLSGAIGSSSTRDADEFIDFAVDGAQRMQHLIEDLLAFSRVGTRGRPARADRRGSRAATRCSTDLRAADRRVGRDRHATTTLPDVRGRPAQLEQLFRTCSATPSSSAAAAQPRVHVEAPARRAATGCSPCATTASASTRSTSSGSS